MSIGIDPNLATGIAVFYKAQYSQAFHMGSLVNNS